LIIISTMAQLKSKPDNRTDEQKQGDFLKRLEEYGSVTDAAKLSKVPRRTIYNWLEPTATTHAEFRAQYKISVKIGVQALEDEAKRRAFKGVNEPLMHLGKKVGTVKKYSDTLLIFLLKAHDPEKYVERIQHAGDPDKPIKHEVVKTIVQFRDMTKAPEDKQE